VAAKLTGRQAKLLETLHLAHAPWPVEEAATVLGTTPRRLRDDVLALVCDGVPVIVTDEGIVVANTRQQRDAAWSVIDKLRAQADALSDHAGALVSALVATDKRGPA
jgi:antitoxin (DNA-binding transcriptional repressor) of toxin-antitoxin stability system